MDEARRLRDEATDNDAHHIQVIKDADSADSDAERARSEAAGFATEAAYERQEAGGLGSQTDEPGGSNEISILNGRAEDNDQRERESISAAEASETRARQLRSDAAEYANAALRLRSDANAAELDAKR